MTRHLGGISGPMFWVLLASTPVLAQPASPATTGVRVEVEGHGGALWPQPPRVIDPGEQDPPATTTAAVGGRFALYFTDRGLGGRLKLQITGQYAELGSFDYFDLFLKSRARTEGHWFTVTPALGVDLFRMGRITVTAHAGPSLVGEMTTFLLERAHPDEDGGISRTCAICRPSRTTAPILTAVSRRLASAGAASSGGAVRGTSASITRGSATTVTFSSARSGGRSGEALILQRSALGLVLASVAALGSIQQTPIDIEGFRRIGL